MRGQRSWLSHWSIGVPWHTWHRLEVVVLGSPWTLVPSCGGPDDVAGSGGGGGAGGAMA